MIPAQVSAITLYRKRRDERGAAVFLVVMVLTLISAIGVFSMRSAGLVDVASGFNRQNVQASFMAEYAARAAATYLGSNESLVESTTRVAGCAIRLQAADPNAPCTVLKTNLLADAYGDSSPVAFNDGLSGLLSLPGQPTLIQAEFVTELVEPGPANAMSSPGFVTGEFKQITFTSIARVYPTDASLGGVCSPASRGAVSQQTVRAHVVVPHY
jgi:Tfp pilus assembly protein PilX